MAVSSAVVYLKGLRISTKHLCVLGQCQTLKIEIWKNYTHCSFMLTEPKVTNKLITIDMESVAGGAL